MKTDIYKCDIKEYKPFKPVFKKKIYIQCLK